MEDKGCIMNIRKILERLNIECRQYFETPQAYQNWLNDKCWQKYRYAGIDACGGCKSLFTHKPVLKQYGGNYVWEQRWYQSLFLNSHATQLDICTDQHATEIEGIQLTCENAILIDFKQVECTL